MPLALRCPACRSSSVRAVPGSDAALQTFHCDDCQREWSSAFRPSGTNLSKRRCSKCASADLVFLEHTPTTAVFRCLNCDQVIALPTLSA